MNETERTVRYLMLDGHTGGFREIDLDTAEISPGDRVIVLYRAGDRFVTLPGASWMTMTIDGHLVLDES